MIAHRHSKASRFNRFVEAQMRNYQTKVFALPADGDVNIAAPVDDAAFERAKARLMEIDFVGLTEQYAQSLQLFEALAGIRFAPLPHANKSRGYAPSTNSPARS